MEYWHTNNMVAYFMAKPIQGKKFIKFRDRIMGMTQKLETEKIREDEKWNVQSQEKVLILIKQTTVLNLKNPKLQECVGKVETNMIF